MIGALLTGLWRLAVSLLFWWLYLVKHSAMHGLCHCLELFINSMWWVYRVHSFHKDILLIATSNCRLVRSVGCVPYSAKQRLMDSASTEALLPCPVYPSLRKYYCLKGGLCSSKDQLPLVPYFCSWATGKSFHRFRALGSQQFFQEYSLLAVWKQWNKGVVYLLSVLGVQCRQHLNYNRAWQLCCVGFT